MAYCKSCGAYIPDGQTGCIACGFDENVKPSYAAEAQAKKTEQNEDMREILERHRKLQQEKNKQWAENEKARREQQEENRRWAREEYARRQAEREVRAEEAEREENRRRENSSTETFRSSSASGNTALAALSYLSVLFVLPFALTPEDGFAKYHAKQGLRLFIFSAVADIIGSIFPIGWILSLFRIYCIFKGISNAINGRKEPLPYIGTIGRD